MHLFDLKSAALELLVERLGLADPDRWTWCLRNRGGPFPQCPIFDYTVIQRNFDPITLAPSRYVNGNLYTYVIRRIFPRPPILAMPTSTSGSGGFLPQRRSLARDQLPSIRLLWVSPHQPHPRDDVGGLRYLYRTNNMNIEGAGAGTLTYVTDTAQTNLLYTSNLTTLASQALTTNAAALQALYPDLSIASTTAIYTNIWVTNITAYFTNRPFDPIGTPPRLTFATNRTLTVQTWYHHTFNNVVEFQFINNVWTTVPLPDIVHHTGYAWITVQTTAVTNAPWTPIGSGLATNITTVTYLTNQVVGAYFIVPTNLCGVSITALQATLDTCTTNVVLSATNAASGSVTNNSTNNFSQVVIEYFTQKVFLANPILCLTNSVAVRQGIEKVSFVRRDYDSLLGQFYYPITNYYTLTAVTNNQLFPQRIQRVVNRPDILFRASDLAGGCPTVCRLLFGPRRTTAPMVSSRTWLAPARLRGP